MRKKRRWNQKQRVKDSKRTKSRTTSQLLEREEKDEGNRREREKEE